MRRTNLAGVPALQHRITLDADMGELYTWLRGKAPSARAREMLYLVRLGFELHSGRLASLERGGGAFGAADRAASFGSHAADQAEATLTGSFDLEGLCNPSPPR